MRSRTLPQVYNYEQQQHGEASGANDFKFESLSPLPTFERISPDGKNPAFPPPLASYPPHQSETSSDYSGKGKERQN